MGRLDLIPAVFGNVTVPRAVWSELIQPGTRPDVVATVQAAAWIEILDDPGGRDLGLDPGETAAINLATLMHADAVLIDERRGRGVAVALGLTVIGTLGILAGAKRRDVVNRVRPIVEELRADGFWIADSLVEAFLSRLGETA